MPSISPAIWKLKSQVKNLGSFSSSTSNMVSFYLPAGGSISLATQFLNEHIKNEEKICLRNAIRKIIDTLASYTSAPETGLAIFSADAAAENLKEEEITTPILISLIPPLPVACQDCFFDTTFQTDLLRSQINSLEASEGKKTIGYVIVSSTGTLLGRVTGTKKETLAQVEVSLPKSNKRGGRSFIRLKRFRNEKIQQYVAHVAKVMNELFITEHQVNVSAMVYADGSFKVHESSGLDYRLQQIEKQVVQLNDTSVEIGFNEAIAQTKPEWVDNREKESINEFFAEVVKEEPKAVYGAEQVLEVLGGESCTKVLVWDELPIRISTEGAQVRLMSIEEFERLKIENPKVAHQAQLLAEWIVDLSTKKKCSLEILSGESTEMKQFIQGFGGIAALLTSPVQPKRDGEATLAAQQDEQDELTGFE